MDDITAITPLHFTLITKYAALFVAQSLLYPTVAITRFNKNARLRPFPRYFQKLLYERSVLLIPNTTGVESAYTNVIGRRSPISKD